MFSAQVVECMMGGGIAPTLGASHFAIEKYILVEVKDGQRKHNREHTEIRK